jgi:hypothetical protein
MQLEVRVVFRVKPEDAPFMVATLGPRAPSPAMSAQREQRFLNNQRA